MKAPSNFNLKSGEIHRVIYVKKYSCLCIHYQNGDYANCINRFMLQKYSESKVVTFGLINGAEAVDCDEASENEEEVKVQIIYIGRSLMLFRWLPKET